MNNTQHSFINNFPPEFVPNSEKKTIEYGRKYAMAMWQEWAATYISRALKFEKLRKYANGKQDLEDCKKRLYSMEFVNQDMLNVDFDKRIPILPRQLRKAYNGINMDEFSINVFALDPTALEEKQNRKKEKEKLLYAKDFINDLTQLTGQEIVPQEAIPQSQEQIDLEEETAEPLKIEQSEQLGIKAVLMDNNFSNIQEQLKKDLLIVDLGVVSVCTDKNSGIKINYEKPESYIYEPGCLADLSKSNYHGVRKSITVRELRRIAINNGIELDDDTINKICRTDKIHDDRYVDVLFFSFKTSHNDIFKKKINRKTRKVSFIERENYDPKQPSDISQKITQSYDVWYEGVVTLDSTYTVIKYNLIENLPEYKGEILPPFIGCSPRLGNSIVEECIGFIDEIQALDFKRQHLEYELRGNITEIDSDTIADISLGEQPLKPKEVLALYFTRGLSFRKTRDKDGEDLNYSTTAIREQPSAIPYALRETVDQLTLQINFLKEQFGFATNDETKPADQTLLDGEPYRLSDNLSMKDIVDANFKLSLDVCRTVSARLNDIFKYSDIKNKYINMIGSDDIDTIEKYKKNRSSHYFGLDMDYIPTRKERMQLITDLNFYVQQGMLDPIDAQELRWTKDIKLAYKIARLRINERQKKAQQFEMDKQSQATNGNVEASRISNEEKRKTLQLEHDLALVRDRLKFEDQAKLTEIDGNYKLEIANVGAENKINLDKFRKQIEVNLTEYKKDRDAELNKYKQDTSFKNQADLIKLRRGEIQDVGNNQFQEVNLNNN